MKKNIFLFCFFVLTLIGCDLGMEENTDYMYRYSITVDTDLRKLRIDNTYLDSTTILPYTLIDWTENHQIGAIYILYPIEDTGFIKLMFYAGKSFKNPSLTFKDSLTIYTPIDTTFVQALFDNNELGTLTIIPNPDH